MDIQQLLWVGAKVALLLSFLGAAVFGVTGWKLALRYAVFVMLLSLSTLLILKMLPEYFKWPETAVQAEAAPYVEPVRTDTE